MPKFKFIQFVNDWADEDGLRIAEFILENSSGVKMVCQLGRLPANETNARFVVESRPDLEKIFNHGVLYSDESPVYQGSIDHQNKKKGVVLSPDAISEVKTLDDLKVILSSAAKKTEVLSSTEKVKEAKL